MKRMFLLVGLLGATLVLPARPASASWVSQNCSSDNHWVDSLKRIDARSYADVAVNEGYEWGGGCWNNDNRDNTPGQPDSDGEGPDCSGLVFKTWELRSTEGQDGFQWYNRLQNIHGPYSSSRYHAPQSGDPFYKLANKDRITTLYMDAFAKDGHVGLLYVAPAPGDDTDLILEARGDADGVGKWQETYRYDSAYVAVRRRDWTPDCSPRCPPSPPVERTVVVS